MAKVKKDEERLTTGATLVKDDNTAKMAAGGILMPMLKNKWRIGTVSILDEAETEAVTLQAISMKYRFNAPTGMQFGFVQQTPHDLKLIFEEPITGSIAPIVKKLMSQKFDITILQLDGDTTTLKTTTFKNCSGVGYAYDLDYAAFEACKYPLEFKCEDIIYS